MLWFDVEEGYNTTDLAEAVRAALLWFDVEEGYNTTKYDFRSHFVKLWFDVEEGYNTTCVGPCSAKRSCGLM